MPTMMPMQTRRERASEQMYCMQAEGRLTSDFCASTSRTNEDSLPNNERRVPNLKARQGSVSVEKKEY